MGNLKFIESEPNILQLFSETSGMQTIIRVLYMEKNCTCLLGERITTNLQTIVHVHVISIVHGEQLFVT